MSQAKKQYVIVFWKSWWNDELAAFGPFTSKAKAAKAMAALYRSDWYSGMGYVKADRMLKISELNPLSLEDLPD